MSAIEREHLTNSLLVAGKDLLCGLITAVLLYLIAWICHFNPEWEWSRKIIDELKTPSIICFLSPLYTLATICTIVHIILCQNEKEDRFYKLKEIIDKEVKVTNEQKDAILREQAKTLIEEIENHWTYKPVIRSYLYYLGIFLISSTFSTALSEWSFSVMRYLIPLLLTYLTNALSPLTIPKYPNYKTFRCLIILLIVLDIISNLYF